MKGRFPLLLFALIAGLSCDSSQFAGAQEADECYLDVACPLDRSIPDGLIRAAVTTTMEGATVASGSGVLLNNVRGDRAPYVLTARHNRMGRHDDLNESLGWIEFHIGYRNQVCNANRPLTRCSQDPCCIQGGTVVATGADRDGWTGSAERDFRLIRLSRAIPPFCNASYAGWSLDTTRVVDGIIVGYPEGRPLAAVISDGPMRGLPNAGSPGLLWAPITQGQLVLGQSGSPLCDASGKVLGVVRMGTPCPPQPLTGTIVPTLVHNWLHGPPGGRLVDHLANGDLSVISLPALE